MPEISGHLQGPWQPFLLAEDGEHVWASPDDVPAGEEVAISVVRGAALTASRTGSIPADFVVDELDVLYLFEPEDSTDWAAQLPVRWEQAQAVASALNALPGQPSNEPGE